MTSAAYLIISSRDELLRFNVNNIVYFEANGNYSTIILANGYKATISMKLGQLQELISKTLGLKAPLFVRVGRSYIINVKFIQAIITLQQKLILSDGLNFTYNISLPKEALKRLRDLIIEKVSLK